MTPYQQHPLWIYDCTQNEQANKHSNGKGQLKALTELDFDFMTPPHDRKLTITIITVDKQPNTEAVIHTEGKPNDNMPPA